MHWRDALLRLHVGGWDSDDIDAAAESLSEACTDGPFADAEIRELSRADVARVLGSELPERDLDALRVVADLRSQASREADALADALFDLDAFAYAHEIDD